MASSCLHVPRTSVANPFVGHSLPASLQVCRVFRRLQSSQLFRCLQSSQGFRRRAFVACVVAGLSLQHEHRAHEGTVAGYLGQAQSRAHNLLKRLLGWRFTMQTLIEQIISFRGLGDSLPSLSLLLHTASRRPFLPDPLQMALECLHVPEWDLPQTSHFFILLAFLGTFSGRSLLGLVLSLGFQHVSCYRGALPHARFLIFEVYE